MVYTPPLGHRGMEGLIGNTRRRVRSRYFMDGCSQFFFVRQTRKVIQLLKRKCLYGKVISQKRGNETYAVTLRTKSPNFDLWASYRSRGDGSGCACRGSTLSRE